MVSTLSHVSGSTNFEEAMLSQISPLQLTQFWLQFSLAWQLGRGLLGVDCRPDIHELCMQLLLEPTQRMMARLKEACAGQDDSKDVQQQQHLLKSAASRMEDKGDLAEPVKSCSEAARHLTILFANITSWSSAAHNFLLERDVQCLLVAEHHQRGANFDLLKRQCVESGWKGSYSPAALSEAGGTRAGVFAVARRHLKPAPEME